MKSNTEILIPAILDWSDDPENPIGAEYIIMEHASGAPLENAWPNISLSQRIKTVGSICRNIMQISTLEYPAYGSLYFSDAPFLQGLQTFAVNSQFCVGPSCRVAYWNCDVADLKYHHYAKPNQGPC